jgi:hypothetical protein
MTGLRRKKQKGRMESGSFIALPHALVRSPNWQACGGSAIKVVLHLAAQYNGHNNGDLSAPLSAKPGGIASPSTLDRALTEAQHYGLILVTRHGGRNRASLYALTWQAIDHCKGKLEVGSTNTSPGDWKDPHQPFKSKAKKRIVTTDSVRTRYGIRSNGSNNVVPLLRIAK